MVSAKRTPVDPKRFLQETGQLFADQYYHIYNARLTYTRKALIDSSRDRWGNDVKNVPLEELNASLGSTDVFVIGTLFKLMPKQPSILRELEENEATPRSLNTNFTCDEDSLVLHETDENVVVVGDINVHKHVTGIPVALLGHQLNGGAKFHVTDVCYAGPSLSVYKMPQAGKLTDASSTKAKRLLIVSGLEFGFDSSLSKDESQAVINGLKRLIDYVLDSDKQTISKLIIAGNSVAPGYTKAKSKLMGAAEANDNRSLNELFLLFDKYLYTLAQSAADLVVMPGKNDPASFLLPQQPFHPKILPKSGLLENVFPTTNPCVLDYDGLTILGTSGENIDAIRQYSRIETSSQALVNSLEWGHIAPNAPDNLSCVPFKDRDPFIIDFLPDIYFAGNQPEFLNATYSTETKTKMQIISVPSFVKTLECVVVDLSNLEVELVSFKPTD